MLCHVVSTYISSCLCSLFILSFVIVIHYSIIFAKMGLSYAATLLLLSFTYPSNILAQHHGGGGGHSFPGAPPPASTAAPATATDVTSAASAPASVASQPAPSASPATNSAVGGSATSAATSPSSTSGGGGGGACTGSGMEIQWSGEAVSYSWSGGSGTTTGCTNLGSSFEGQVAVGGSGGTIFEGNPSGYFDVSYILGYSVPMLCSSGSEKTGCSKDLLGNGGKPGTIHKNPTGPGGAHDPGSYNGCATCTPWCYACSAADPFFAPCSGSAYTYPYDDTATVGPASGTINCCIGTSCGTTGREGSTANGHPELTRNPPCGLCAGSSKRSVDELEEVFKRYEDAPEPAHSATQLPRKRKVHKRHAMVHEAKVLG